MSLKQCRLVFALCAILSFSCLAQAQSSAVGENNSASLPGATQPTINQAAQTGQNSQNMGQIANMIAAGALMAACMSSDPPNYPLCVMGALSAMQAGADAGAAGDSGATFDASAYNPSSLGTTPATPTADTGKSSFTNPQIAQGMQKLSDAGYKVTPSSVTMPDGSTVPTSSLSTAQGMMDAGFSPASVDAAMNTLGDVNAKIKKELGEPHVSAMAVKEGAGGGGAGMSSAGGGSTFTFPKFVNPFAHKNSEKLIAGKTVTVGGTQIGVKMDDIFEMVHRAYQKKRREHQFIENDSGIPSHQQRLPSSIGGP